MRLYGFLTKLHRRLYEIGLLESVSLNKKVISVGNLTFGGTGKTPFVKNLAGEIKNCAIIVRSYRGSARESARMDQEKAKHPEVWGDEACWYAQNVTVPVYSGPKKWESAILAAENKEVDVLIVDDGFQHHKLKKDIQIILVDAVKGIDDLKYRSRDHISELRKASAVVITRSDMVSVQSLEDLKRYLNFSGPVFLNKMIPVVVRGFDGKPIKGAEYAGEKVGLVSGVANPQSFLSLMKSIWSDTEFIEMKFSDHHEYREDDLKNISKQNFSFIVTTEKDEAKLKNMKHNFSKWGVLEISSFIEQGDKFQNFLKGSVL